MMIYNACKGTITELGEFPDYNNPCRYYENNINNVITETIKELENIRFLIAEKSNCKRTGDEDTIAMRFWHTSLNNTIKKLLQYKKETLNNE